MRDRPRRTPLRELTITIAAPLKPPTRTGKPDCAHCAAVCCRLIVVVEAADGIPEHLTTRTETGLRVMTRAADGWCVALDRERMACSIYADRPDGCRRFVMAGPYCRAVREDFTRAETRPIPQPLIGGHP